MSAQPRASLGLQQEGSTCVTAEPVAVNQQPCVQKLSSQLHQSLPRAAEHLQAIKTMLLCRSAASRTW